MIVMWNLRKPCLIIHFRRNHGFYGGHFEIDHKDQLVEKSSIGNLILTLGMYLNQMVPLMRTFMHKQTCCLKLCTKKWKKLTISKNCILRHIYNIQNSFSRWDATVKLYFFYYLKLLFFYYLFLLFRYMTWWIEILNTTIFDITGPTLW